MHLACKVCGGVIAASALFFIYEMFTYQGFGIKANWNFFTSWLAFPLYIIGLVLSIVYWGKFGHWSSVPYIEYKDEYGKKHIERNDDVIENTFLQILMPILGHFVLEPLVYACMIYYPIVCVVALFGAVLPYLITILLIALCVLLFAYDKYVMKLPYRTVVLVAGTFLLALVLTCSSISMEKKKAPTFENITNQIEKAASDIEID